MNINKIIQNSLNEILNEGSLKIPKPNKNLLYHGTNIKNLENIKRYGLVPDFGDIVKSTEAYGYYMDDEYVNPDDRVDGVIFFANTPNTWSYSHYGATPKIEEAVLVIVKKNETIYRKDSEYVYDMKNRSVETVDYIPVDKIPFFIENGDYFSFEEQEPIDILYGERLIMFMKQF